MTERERIKGVLHEVHERYHSSYRSTTDHTAKQTALLEVIAEELAILVDAVRDANGTNE